MLLLCVQLVREAGGVCIADEVQTGFGRTGSHFWGFQNHGVQPDIVTMAKVRCWLLLLGVQPAAAELASRNMTLCQALRACWACALQSSTLLHRVLQVQRLAHAITTLRTSSAQPGARMQGIGNGLPLAAVVTTPEIAQSLASKLHFNTFGGNPVCCAGGRAVLQALDEDNCQQNSAEVSRTGYACLRALRRSRTSPWPAGWPRLSETVHSILRASRLCRQALDEDCRTLPRCASQSSCS